MNSFRLFQPVWQTLQMVAMIKVVNSKSHTTGKCPTMPVAGRRLISARLLGFAKGEVNP
jgi:hypothetical protein